MDYNPPHSSVHRILQARILEWVAIPFSRGFSDLRIEPGSPALQADSFTEPPGKPGNSEKHEMAEGGRAFRFPSSIPSLYRLGN